MTIMGMAIAEMDRYDWALMLTTYVLVLVALLLDASLWLSMGCGFVPLTTIAIRCARRNLFGDPEVDRRSATPKRGHTGDEPGRSSSNTRPATLRPQPPATDRP
jgi:hypothetical protein